MESLLDSADPTFDVDASFDKHEGGDLHLISCESEIMLTGSSGSEGSTDLVLINLGDGVVQQQSVRPLTSRTTSSSSSSYSSSEEDFFQLDATDLNQSTLTVDNSEHQDHQQGNNVAPQPQPQPQPQPHLHVTGEGRGGFFAQLDDGILADVAGAKQSPPVQVMARGSEEGRVSTPDDPYCRSRIPASVFEPASNSASPAAVEWSVTSNESLFSIQMGSSSREEPCWATNSLPGSPLDQLGLLVAGNPFDLLPPYNQSSSLQIKCNVDSSTAASEEAHQILSEHSIIAESSAGEAQGLDHPTTVTAAAESAPPSASTSQRSDGSMGSVGSFAFPIMADGRSGSINVGTSEQHNMQQQQQQEEGVLMKQLEAMEEETRGGLRPSPSPSPSPDPDQFTTGPAAGTPHRMSWCRCFSCRSFCWC